MVATGEVTCVILSAISNLTAGTLNFEELKYVGRR